MGVTIFCIIFFTFRLNGRNILQNIVSTTKYYYDMNNVMFEIDVPQNTVMNLNYVMLEIDVQILYRAGNCPSLCW